MRTSRGEFSTPEGKKEHNAIMEDMKRAPAEGRFHV